MNRIGTKIRQFTIIDIYGIDTSGNKVYACVCDKCTKRKGLGLPVFPAKFQDISRMRCWCDRKYHFNDKQRQKLVMQNLSKTKFTLFAAPSIKEEWHRESQIALQCEYGHTTFTKVGKVMFDQPKCDVCIGIEKKKPKHLAVKIVSDYAKSNGYAVKQVSGWAGNSTQYQVTCKQHGSFDLSLTRIKSNTRCEICSSYEKSPAGL
ncbi:hypothetical protein AsFcp4_40 [Aeromonas phage AsFcp_4]|nr:hypothetical protein AsFcp4_40 [Aeromonas phage AsFcp_4]